MALNSYPLIPKHMQQEDEGTLKSIEYGEDPSKHNGSSVHNEETKDPCQSNQRKENKRGLHNAPMDMKM